MCKRRIMYHKDVGYRRSDTHHFQGLCGNGSQKYPNKTAVSFLGTTYSYRKLLDLTERFAAALAVCRSERARSYSDVHSQLDPVCGCMARHSEIRSSCGPHHSDLHVVRSQIYCTDTGAKAVVCADRNYGYVKQSMADTAHRTGYRDQSG